MKVVIRTKNLEETLHKINLFLSNLDTEEENNLEEIVIENG